MYDPECPNTSDLSLAKNNFKDPPEFFRCISAINPVKTHRSAQDHNVCVQASE